MTRPTEPWAQTPEALALQLNTDLERGLNSLDADRRLENTGENRIAEFRQVTFKDILLEEIREPMIILLLVIGVLYGVLGGIGDAITILFIIAALVLVEVYTEFRAKQGIEALRHLAQPTTWVMRDGRPLEIETSHLVPGDVLILKRGVMVGADARVVAARGLAADESQLTGEAMGAARRTAVLPPETGLNDRFNMVHMGSVIVKGQGTALVVATGRETELGRVADLTQTTREPRTPLQRSMRSLARGLIWLAVFFSLLVPFLGAMRGLPVTEMILTGLALAFATIPEELPIIVTMMLAIGALTLSRHGILVRRTRAAETLGGVTVIATDKTGTLTENRTRLARWHTHNVHRLFELGALTAETVYDAFGSFLGDPMDKAIADQAEALGIDRLRLQRDLPLLEDHGFDESNRIYEAVFDVNGQALTIIRGAPESVMARCTPDPRLEKAYTQAISDGYRVTAIASRRSRDERFASDKRFDSDGRIASDDRFTLEGLFCFDDPVRPDVAEAVAAIHEAGVRIVMITGDHAVTARRVARDAGINVTGVLTGEDLAKLTVREMNASVRGVNLFTRVTPAQKLAIVNRLHENGEVVAVTGDGINDAPALRAADIGIAMGQTGTDVAKEAADMVLTGDSFPALVMAIREGRRLYANLSKAVAYYLACKAALVMIFLLPVLFGTPVPFSPIQIILLELFMDLAASIAFVSEPVEPDAMRRDPRDPCDPFMDGRMLRGIGAGSLALAILVMSVFFLAWNRSGVQTFAQTLAFAAWLLGHVALAFSMRRRPIALSRDGLRDFFSNRAFNYWGIGVLVFTIVAVYTPGLNQRLDLQPVNPLFLLALAVVCVAACVAALRALSTSRANGARRENESTRR